MPTISPTVEAALAARFTPEQLAGLKLVYGLAMYQLAQEDLATLTAGRDRLPAGTPVEGPTGQRGTVMRAGVVVNCDGELIATVQHYKGYPVTYRAADLKTAAELGYTLGADGEWVKPSAVTAEA